MVAPLFFTNTHERQNIACQWMATGEYVSNVPKTSTYDPRADVLEEFTQSEDPFLYTFSYALYAYDPETNELNLVDQSIVKDRVVPGNNSTAVKLNVREYRYSNVSPMRLILSDMTNYVPRQPLLKMFLVVNEDDLSRRVRMPAVFDAQWSELPKNRQLDMQMPPFETLKIEYDLKGMRL